MCAIFHILSLEFHFENFLIKSRRQANPFQRKKRLEEPHRRETATQNDLLLCSVVISVHPAQHLRLLPTEWEEVGLVHSGAKQHSLPSAGILISKQNEDKDILEKKGKKKKKEVVGEIVRDQRGGRHDLDYNKNQSF